MALTLKERVDRAAFATMLFGIPLAIDFTARSRPAFRKKIAETNFIAQIKVRDEPMGRWFEFRDGAVTSGAGIHEKPDVAMVFKNAGLAVGLLSHPDDHLSFINAAKMFQVAL